MGILATGVSIVVMCSAGIAVSTVFKWLHNFEFNMSNKNTNVRGGNDDRMNQLSNRVRPNNK